MGLHLCGVFPTECKKCKPPVVFNFPCSLWQMNLFSFLLTLYILSLASNLFLYLSNFSPAFPPGFYAKETAFYSNSELCCSETGMWICKTKRINVSEDEFHYLPNSPWKLMRSPQIGSFPSNVKSSIEFLYLFKNKFVFMACIIFSSLN